MLNTAHSCLFHRLLCGVSVDIIAATTTESWSRAVVDFRLVLDHHTGLSVAWHQLSRVPLAPQMPATSPLNLFTHLQLRFRRFGVVPA